MTRLTTVQSTMIFVALIWALLLSSFALQAQADGEVNPDEFCVNFGEPFPFSVLDNDIVPDGSYIEFSTLESQCFFLDPESGNLIWGQNAEEEFCCGITTFFYGVMDPEGNFVGENSVTIEVKCGKPDCSVIDLSAIGEDELGGGEQTATPCINVCENSEVVIFHPYSPQNDYVWDIQEPYTVGDNPAQITVSFGDAGSSVISLQIITPGGSVNTLSFCINILASPDAEYTTDGYACLNAPMTFENLYPYAASYTWDFGDGTIVQNDGQFVQHTYTTPGNYTVVLSATLPVYDNSGNALCCCTATFESEVTVDPLEGPQIECVSTLCEGDEATYTTNAAGCSDYQWTVLDANGNPVAFTGQGTPEISVVWGAGPFGTVSLLALGCDEDYCPSPTTVTIPIISAVSDVNGPDVVCQNATHTYSVPKWPGTTYTWTVTGGTVVSGGDGHTVEIEWGPGPGGSISVEYISNFLYDLTEHDGADCQGHAHLDVEIRPQFELINYNPIVCVDEVSFLYVTSFPSDDYTWTVTPAPNGVGVTPSSGFAEFTWSTQPGTYLVTVTPNDGSAYCNSSQSTVVTVLSNDPPLALDGPNEVCPGETAFYTATPSQPGATFQWTIIDNAVTTVASGPTISVTWSANPGSVSVTQTIGTAPGCQSAPITLNVTPKTIQGPLEILGDAMCNNSEQSYSLSPTQHPDADVVWSIIPANAGTVVGGQGTENVDIQWNNYIGPVALLATVNLCSSSELTSTSLNLVAAVQPQIVQNGFICPGGNGQLETTQTFDSYSWSTGDSTPTTTVSQGGWYSVTTEDANGCFATDYFEAIESPSPIADISTANNLIICIPTPHTVTIVAQTGVNYEFTWYLNGATVVQGPSAVSSYTHSVIGIPGSYTYSVEVTNTVTGCTSVSDVITVYETDDCSSGIGCQPEPYTLEPFVSDLVPDCNEITFNAGASANFTPTLWVFGDGNFSTGANPIHSYDEAGCYNVKVFGNVPSVDSGFCQVVEELEVCVPLVARFEFEAIDCGTFDFTNTSTWLDPPFGTTIQSVLWGFGASTSATYDASYTFPGPGVYPVTLTVTNSSGCTTSTTQNITVTSVGDPVINVTAPVCAGDVTSFMGVAPGAVSYEWSFGDPNNSSFVGQNALFTYLSGGPYTVTLTVTDQAGCTKQTSTQIEVYPGVPDSPILGSTVYCAGGSTTLSAPVSTSYTYLWSTGETTDQIAATAGIYSVTITNQFGCERTLGPVTVIEVPGPTATIDGSNFICDSGCETLTAPFDNTYNYKWYDGNNNELPWFTSNTATICAYESLPATFVVEIVDQNGCSAFSDPFTVELANSPSLTLSNTGSGCAGSPNVLEVSPNDPNIAYTWSTGASGTTITASLAGDYSVTGVDLTTGCSSTVSTTINPLPEFCSMPVGCYEQCDSITVCVAEGLGTYQWNLNTIPIPGANSNCLFVEESGTYTLTVTTPDGCTDTSGELEITIVPCGDCENVEITFEPSVNDDGTINECCVDVSYNIDEPSISSIRFTTSDASFAYDGASLDPALLVQQNTASEIRFVNADLSDVLPQGVLSNFFTLCVTDPQTLPQMIYADWLDVDGNIVCQDSIEMNCPVEPPCLYLLEDSVYCELGQTFYQFTVCNPLDQAWSVGFIELNALTPSGITILPSGIDLSSNPILPGSCQTITVELTGSGIGGETFCYSMIGHESDPIEDPATLCCSLEGEYCIDLPQCDPCDFVWVTSVVPTSEEDCCYQVTLQNDYDGAFFDEIHIVSLSNNTSFSINNPAASGWTAQGYTGTSVSFIPGATFGGFAPLGSFTLPEICVETLTAPAQQFTVLWMKDGEVLCESDFSVDCEPPCGYIFDEVIECDEDNGEWIISGFIKNTADYIVAEAVISFSSASGLSAYNQTISLGTLNPGDVFGPFSMVIGSPAQAGDEVCFTVTLHEVNADGLYLNCCNFEHCIVLPDCGFAEPCRCDENFANAVSQGFSQFNMGWTYTFWPTASYAFNDECDFARWSFQTGSTGIVMPSDSVTHTFPGPGVYTVCMRIYRVDVNGNQCAETYCQSINVGLISTEGIDVYPNPSDGIFFVAVENPELKHVELDLYDNTGRPVWSANVPEPSPMSRVMIDVNGNASQGMYMLRVRMGDTILTRKVILSR